MASIFILLLCGLLLYSFHTLLPREILNPFWVNQSWDGDYPAIHFAPIFTIISRLRCALTAGNVDWIHASSVAYVFVRIDLQQRSCICS